MKIKRSELKRLIRECVNELFDEGLLYETIQTHNLKDINAVTAALKKIGSGVSYDDAIKIAKKFFGSDFLKLEKQGNESWAVLIDGGKVFQNPRLGAIWVGVIGIVSDQNKPSILVKTVPEEKYELKIADTVDDLLGNVSEMSTTGAVQGYQTPHAFSKRSMGNIKSATTLGYTLVGDKKGKNKA